MKQYDAAYTARMADVIFQPALTPMEAAMLPARMPRRMGALRHARESFAPGGRKPAGRSLRLPGWGPHRQKI